MKRGPTLGPIVMIALPLLLWGADTRGPGGERRCSAPHRDAS